MTRRRILLFDQEEDLVWPLESVLEGDTIVHIERPDQVEQELATNKYGLVLAEPYTISGGEAERGRRASVIKTIGKQGVPVIMFTTQDTESLNLLGLTPGIDYKGHIPKPFELTQVRTAVDQHYQEQ